MATKSPNTSNDTPATRFERVLAAMITTILGLTLVCFAALLIASALGVPGTAFSSGIWPVVATIPLIALPLGFVAIIVLIVANARRRRAASRD